MPFTPIHRLLGLEASDLTPELFAAAVREHLQEQTDLDWKADFSSKPNYHEEVAKDLAAIANAGGGWLIYGIREGKTPQGHEDGRAEELVGVADPGKIAQRIREVAWNHVSPALLKVRTTVIPDIDRPIVAVHVPASTDTPHLARYNTGFRAPVRDGAHTRDMSEAELEQAYQGRFRERERVRQTLAELYNETNDLALAQRKVRFVGVAVPRHPRPLSAGRLEVLAASEVFDGARRLARTFANAGGILFPLSDFLAQAVLDPSQLGGTRLTRGLRQWTVSDTVRDDFAMGAVHFDGAVNLTTRVEPSGGQGHSSGRVPTMLVEAQVGALIALARTAQRKLDVPSDYDVQAGLEWTGTNETWTYQQDDGNPGPVSVRRFKPVRTTLPADASGETARAVAYDLALDLLNQGGIAKGTLLKAT